MILGSKAKDQFQWVFKTCGWLFWWWWWMDERRFVSFTQSLATHSSMKICVYLPKRDELSFRTVLAFPKDSKRGVASRIWPMSTGYILILHNLQEGGHFTQDKNSLPLSDESRWRIRRRKQNEWMNTTVVLLYLDTSAVCTCSVYLQCVPAVWCCVCDEWLSNNEGWVW